jgi:hypothetical protein
MSAARFRPPFLSRGLAPGTIDDLPRLYRFYWQACTLLETFFEDVRGTDGREAYLRTLKLRLIEVLYELDESLGSRPPIARIHRLAVALEVGCRTLGDCDGADLTDLFFDGCPDPAMEADRINGLADRFLADVPGDIQAALNTNGQRYILGMLRLWSKLSAEDPDAMVEIRRFLSDL